MMPFRRNPVPNKVIWKQDDRTHLDFYWLAIPDEQAKTGREVMASYKGNVVTIDKNEYDTLIIRLNDTMMNLSKPVEVRYNGKRVFKGKVNRTLGTLQETVMRRHDPGLVFPACIELRKTAGKITAVVI
ncbi:hypothetical protein [Fibrella aquatica]|uniref:hypothetical protein n=1 Tax=Fibrella aquatica TaxID=3242487 RepID=UPI003522BE5D